jgi:Domain of unknown function (DUF4394)
MPTPKTTAALLAVAAAATVTAASAAASAAPALGLVGDRTLVLFDTDEPEVTVTVEVAGVDRLLGIDVRPADGMVYGVAADGAVVTIDPATGAATKVAMLETVVPENGPVVVDFNPAADKLRLMSGVRNLRADVDTGKVTTDGHLAFEAGDMHAGEAPDIVAAAYVNSRGKPEKTAMYDIDATVVTLVQQTSPHDGTLAAIGKLGLDPASSYAFDVHTAADGANTAWLAADGTLHTVDLVTGAATAVAEISGAPGPLRDLTVLPQG